MKNQNISYYECTLTSVIYNYLQQNKVALSSAKQLHAENFCNRHIPNYYSWNLDLSNANFFYIGNDTICMNFRNLTIDLFKSKIHPSFNHILAAVITEFLDDKNKKLFDCWQYVSFSLPFKVYNQEYFITQFTIKPLVTNGIITSFILIVNPLEKYSKKHALNLTFYTNGMVDNAVTLLFKKCIGEPIYDFTAIQRKTLDLVYEEKNCSEISEILEKSKHATFKVNRRITDKISEFYNLEFKDIYEAAAFYKSCC